MACPVAALVLDMFAAPLVDVARDLAVPSYVYMSSTGAMLALMLHLPALHEAVTVEFEEVEEGEIHVPGLPPVPSASMPNPVVDKKNPNYTWFMRLGDRFSDATGIIANSAVELEPGPLAAVAEGRCVPGRPTPPVYPIGPVLSLGDSSARKDNPPEPLHECIAWLDSQPPASVVYLCFGSLGWFEPPQVVEITAALERCGHRFLWVLRGPPGGVSGAGAPDGSEHPTDANLDEVLPEGFLDRTRGRGLVWPRWAPQKEILAHPAVGGFVTHGGWNSALESLWHGVPMAPWPLYAEQHLNAFELVVDMGVAVPLKVDRKRDNFVEAAELERAVRNLMGGGEEGRKAREKAAEMKAVCRKAVAVGGSSYAALQRLSAALHYGAVHPKEVKCGTSAA
uniref:Uncharacterized protein n=1 Tax=Arundo donax TaxID=35708 RepID=A0A0A8YE51_ARUDO